MTYENDIFSVTPFVHDLMKPNEYQCYMIVLGTSINPCLLVQSHADFGILCVVYYELRFHLEPLIINRMIERKGF